MSRISDQDVRACTHPRLPARYALAIVCMITFLPILALLIALSAVTLILVWIILLLWTGAEIFYHYMVDNSVMVSELNYPRIYALAQEVRESLGVKKDFHIFVYEHGQFNAYLLRFFRRRAIFLNSEVLEAGVEDDEVRWLVGRFVGFLRVHQDAGMIGRLLRITENSGIYSLLIFPYTRAMVYTGDRLGLAAIGGDIGAAISTMQKLLVGRQLGYSINPVGIIEQRRLTKGSLFAFLARVGTPFPSTTARYVDLLNFAKQRFPDQFRRFEAGCPGLPEELHLLSGERTSSASVAKAFGYYAALTAGLIVTLLVWSGLIASLSTAGSSSTPDPYLSEMNAMAPLDATADAMENATDATASMPDTSATTTGHVIDKPVFVAGPSAEDLTRVYPAQSLSIGGVGTIDCHVRGDGTVFDCTEVSETPPGSGFGQAAVQLQGTIRLAEKDEDGVAVADGNATIAVTFKPAAGPVM